MTTAESQYLPPVITGELGVIIGVAALLVLTIVLLVKHYDTNSRTRLKPGTPTVTFDDFDTPAAAFDAYQQLTRGKIACLLTDTGNGPLILVARPEAQRASDLLQAGLTYHSPRQ